MKKYYLSHIDFTEIANVTADEKQIKRAKRRMAELGLLTEKGNPAISAIASFVMSRSPAFLIKLQKRLSRNYGGIKNVADTLQKLCDRKDYYGFFLYIAFLYGFLEWQVPEAIILLPAVPEALKCYCNEQMKAINKFMSGNNSGENAETLTSEKIIQGEGYEKNT